MVDKLPSYNKFGDLGIVWYSHEQTWILRSTDTDQLIILPHCKNLCQWQLLLNGYSVMFS